MYGEVGRNGWFDVVGEMLVETVTESDWVIGCGGEPSEDGSMLS